jgi:hypothetical protein
LEEGTCHHDTKDEVDTCVVEAYELGGEEEAYELDGEKGSGQRHSYSFRKGVVLPRGCLVDEHEVWVEQTNDENLVEISFFEELMAMALAMACGVWCLVQSEPCDSWKLHNLLELMVRWTYDWG